ncbi:MAG: hypothetical protein C4528_04060 [Gammaproteobacteria bacterium]|nr:MAG: hypothetical protein C4528_04060 [Gammaproteobacteria bacterium]
MHLGGGAAVDDRETSEAPAHAEQAVTGLAVVLERKVGLHARGSRRDLDRDGVIRCALIVYVEAAGGGANRSGGGVKGSKGEKAGKTETDNDKPPLCTHSPSPLKILLEGA